MSGLIHLQAAKLRWPELFDNVDSSLEDWIVDQMHIVRLLFYFFSSNFLQNRLDF